MAKLGPLPDVAGVVKIRLVGKTSGGVNWANVMHAKVTGVLSTATLNTVATAIRGYWLSDLAPKIIIGNNLSLVEVTDLGSRTGNQGTDTTGGNGAQAATGAPSNVAVCLTLKIPNRYRGGHPRLYMPGVNNADASNGATLSTTAQNAYTAAGRAFLGHVNAIIVGATTWQLAAVSYYHTVNQVPAYKYPPDVYIISDIICRGRLDSMRRRLGKEA